MALVYDLQSSLLRKTNPPCFPTPSDVSPCPSIFKSGEGLSHQLGGSYRGDTQTFPSACLRSSEYPGVTSPAIIYLSSFVSFCPTVSAFHSHLSVCRGSSELLT